jgi:hypothetical protein
VVTKESETISSAVLRIVVCDTLVVSSHSSASGGRGRGSLGLGRCDVGRRLARGCLRGRGSTDISGGRLAGVGVNPADDLSINGGSHDVTNCASGLLLGLGMLLVEMLVAVTLVVRFMLLALLGRRSGGSVDGKLLQLNGTADMNRELVFTSVYPIATSSRNSALHLR